MHGRALGIGIGLVVLLVGMGCSRGNAGHRGFATAEPVQTVSVFYATDRAPEAAPQGKVRYGFERRYAEDQRPELGVCQVAIRRARNHDKATPLPLSGQELLEIQSATVLPAHRFWERLREKMWYADANETFVYVHGFNNSFENSVKRTAELWYDLGFEGPPIVYSWPSRGGSFWRGVFGYFADSETIKWSVAHLRNFLIDLVAETSADRLVADDRARIHLIAHSMGSRALTQALILAAEEINADDGPVFVNVILAAPDIDRDVFRDTIALKLLRSRLAEHYTLYASSADKLLKTSQALQVYPRAGNADDGLVAIEHAQFHTIDASEAHSDWAPLNHDYFVTEPRVIRDLIQVIREDNRDPAGPGRSMTRREDGPGAPWVMVPDEVGEATVAVEVP